MRPQYYIVATPPPPLNGGKNKKESFPSTFHVYLPHHISLRHVLCMSVWVKSDESISSTATRYWLLCTWNKNRWAVTPPKPLESQYSVMCSIFLEEYTVFAPRSYYKKYKLWMCIKNNLWNKKSTTTSHCHHHNHDKNTAISEGAQSFL